MIHNFFRYDEHALTKELCDLKAGSVIETDVYKPSIKVYFHANTSIKVNFNASINKALGKRAFTN